MVATSCARNDIYFEYRSVDPEAWSMDSVCTFAVEVHDTAPAYDLYLYTRNTPAYPYQNLWLFAADGSVSFSPLEFTEAGTYTYTLRHGMRTDPLRGIHDIGMRVEKLE